MPPTQNRCVGVGLAAQKGGGAHGRKNKSQHHRNLDTTKAFPGPVEEWVTHMYANVLSAIAGHTVIFAAALWVGWMLARAIGLS